MSGQVTQDFDALIAADPLSFQLVGRTWQAPVELPHQAMLYLEALEQDHGTDHQLGWSDLVHIARLVFGDSTVDEWIKAGAGLTRLGAVIEWVLGELSGTTPAAEKAGEAANP